MNYAQMRQYDIANGLGVRCTLFVSGCHFNCKSCFNKDYQDFKYGNKWTKELENKFMEYVNSSNVKGVTILGGEPMQQIMDDDLYNLLNRIKNETNKSIWIYSGDLYENIIQNPKKLRILQLCDVLVDGLFINELKDVRLKFRGSSNQRLIDIKKSFKNNQIELLNI